MTSKVRALESQVRLLLLPHHATRRLKRCLRLISGSVDCRFQQPTTYALALLAAFLVPSVLVKSLLQDCQCPISGQQ